MRMGNRFVPISRPSSSSRLKTKKLLLVIQFYEGDRDDAEQLALLIADLERTRNHQADIMLMRRADSRVLNPTVKAKLEQKFDVVHQHTCRRTDAKSYPMACNQMWSDLVTLLPRTMPYATDYYAFINLETDAVPTRPGWIGELITEWEAAKLAGKAAIGHIHNDPVPHLNGLAVYSVDLFQRVGGNRLMGANAQTCYDIYFSKMILPLAQETPLIFFSYRQPTITPDELFAARKGGIAPCLYHGVKDGTARAAVRARHITFTDHAPMATVTPTPLTEPAAISAISAPASVVAQVAPIESILRPFVFCYQPCGRGSALEQKAVVDLWISGWTSRGWNPVVLTLRDATKHLRFDQIQSAMDKLPMVGRRAETEHRFNRWLALDVAGGGFFADLDVLPGAFTPADVTRTDGGLVLSAKESGTISSAIFDKAHLAQFIAAMETYDARPEDATPEGRPQVTDMTVFASLWPDAFEPTVVDGQTGTAKTAKLARFAFADSTTDRPSARMQRFLQGVL